MDLYISIHIYINVYILIFPNLEMIEKRKSFFQHLFSIDFVRFEGNNKTKQWETFYCGNRNTLIKTIGVLYIIHVYYYTRYLMYIRDMRIKLWNEYSGYCCFKYLSIVLLTLDLYDLFFRKRTLQKRVQSLLEHKTFLVCAKNFYGTSFPSFFHNEENGL